MKKHAQSSVLLAGIAALMATLAANAQGTAFTYQGRLNAGGGAANGIYDLRFVICDSTTNGNVVAGPVTNSATGVTNGLFTVTLDFGAAGFTGNPLWLEIAVRTNGAGSFATLAPRQPITPTPYAIMAGSASNLLGTLPTAQLAGTFPASQLTGTIPSADISGTYGNTVSFNNGADSFDGTFVGQFFGSSFFGGSFSGNFFGDGSGLFNLNASQLIGTIPDSHLAANVAFLNSNQVFTAQNIFWEGIGIGNPNPSPFYQIDALASQANLRFVTTNNGNGAVVELKNIITNYDYSYLGAINFNNYYSSYPGQIGYFATNPTNQNNDYMQFRVGGAAGALTLQADPRGDGVSSLVGGTWWNSVDPSSGGDVIAGGGFPGYGNGIYSNSFGVFIGAGSGNHVGPDVNDSVIAGGNGNTIQSSDSAIGGGSGNSIQTVADHATIAGGFNNLIQATGWDSTISGGYGNVIQTNAQFSSIGGGQGNNIHGAASDSSIAGGFYNTIGATNFGNFIGGGQGNLIDSFNTIAVIGGGLDNRIAGNYLYYSNFYATGSTIAGGIINVIDLNNLYDTIGGGWDNVIQSNVLESTIAGGIQNTIESNAASSTIGGGDDNQVGGYYSVVPGGGGNVATGNGSFAAGMFAHATNDGAFVLADDEFTNFYSTADNQLSARFIGGVRFETAGAGMTLDDQPVMSSGSIVNSGQLSGSYSGAVTFNNAGDTFTGNGSGLTGLNASQLTSGTVPSGVFSGNYTNAVTMTNAGNAFAGTGTGLTNVNAALLNGLPSASFAPAVGSTNYIQNQFLGIQNASFQISGSGVFGGTVSAATLATAAALVVTNNAAIAGTVAANSLTLTNTFRVAGAGINTGTAAFIQLSAATNTSGDNTVIYNPLSDGDPNAILVVTHNYNPGMAFNTIYNKIVGVYYNGAHWAIYNEDLSNMSTNITFNVLIIKH